MLLCLMLLESDRDREVFLQLQETYQDKLLRIAYSILKDQLSAEDAVQSTYVKIILNFEKIKALNCKEIGPYIVTMVEHDSLDRLKKDKWIQPLSETWDAPDPKSSTEGGSTYRHLVEIIKSMPQTYRSILIMKFVWEWTDDEIAKKVEMTQGAVSTRISRGRALLIEKLKKEGYCP